MTLQDLREAFPAMHTIQTGGGCTALYLQISNRYVMLTSYEDARVPTDEDVGDDTEPSIDVGLYDDDIDKAGAMGSCEPIWAHCLTVEETIIAIRDMMNYPDHFIHGAHFI